MIIGCSKEIKVHEYRVALTPSNVKEYTDNGHTVYIETNAGKEIGFTNEHYQSSGAIIATKEELFEKAELIIKVKEPIPSEYDYFKVGSSLYTYLHLAADEELTSMLISKKINTIAYETIKLNNKLPCLTPMSAIAGRLAPQQAAKYIEKTFGGMGILMGGVAGTSKASVTIIGAGTVGLNAAQISVGMGADVTILDTDAERLAYIDQIFNMKIKTLISNASVIEQILPTSDIIIGAVLLPGARTPKLIKKEDLKKMKQGSVIVDVSIDQGGGFETSKATTHSEPTYIVDGIVHYCVANMPGAVARTSTIALTNSTLTYGLKIAEKGIKQACLSDIAIMEGLNTYDGKCTYKGVAEAFKLEYTPAKQALS